MRPAGGRVNSVVEGRERQNAEGAMGVPVPGAWRVGIVGIGPAVAKAWICGGGVGRRDVRRCRSAQQRKR